MTTILDIVRARVGRRHKITRGEMRGLLADLATHGLALDNGWAAPNPAGDHAQGWADTCADVTVVSVLADDDPVEPRLSSSNPGSIRYDSPGSMHPMLHATLMFCSAECAERRDTVEYLRARAQRLLIVE